MLIRIMFHIICIFFMLCIFNPYMRMLDHARPDKPDPPGPVADPGQAGEYVVEQLLNRKSIRGRTYYLVRWQGHDAA